MTMQCKKHPNGLMIPNYSYMGGETFLDSLTCSDCEMERPFKFRIPMRLVPAPKPPQTLVEEAVTSIMQGATEKLISGEHTDAKEAIRAALKEFKAPKGPITHHFKPTSNP